MNTLGERGDYYLSRRHWRLLQDHSYGQTSRNGDTVPGNSLFLYSPHHPAETCPLLHQTEPSQGLRGHGHSSAADTPHQLHSCPSGHRKPCPTGRGRKPPHVQNICLSHSPVAIVASLSETQKHYMSGEGTHSAFTHNTYLWNRPRVTPDSTADVTVHSAHLVLLSQSLKSNLQGLGEVIA